ncbi:MAG: EI24 domain-containing protein [Drouetiella hepatica Uher 2000/2452]|jgi:CysZ protein|uniref:EI24 domain-containing protein n=1 Tax=Drouetiella hepatica Uher 2000/2452 TaxID=904376 RepID=A0A951QA94_9CYAN|nr:EI24 domain-containing protein [Drouetiella hepatica Uher 2000/2452]
MELSPKPPQRIDRGLGSLFSGATYPLRALRLFLTTPKLRSYILFPILINLVVGITLYAGLLFAGLEAIDNIIASVPTWTVSVPHWAIDLPDWKFAAPTWLATWLPHLPAWKISLPHWKIPALPLPAFSLPSFSLPNWQPTLPDWIAFLPTWAAMFFIWILRGVLTIALLLLTGFIFLQFGGLLGAPWYGKLSEELERMKTGKVTLVEVGVASDISRAIFYELKKLLLSISVGVPLLLLNFFPGVGTAIATFTGIAFASTIVCMDFMDAAVERRRPGFRQKLGIVWRSMPASGSFGLVCLGLVSIPLVNLLAVPVCVAAGTLFFCDRVLPWYDKDVASR